MSEATSNAAETRASNFADFEPLRPQRICVDQIRSLVVCDDADPLALLHVMPGQACQRGRLTGSEEAADHDVSNLMSHGF